MQAPKIIHVCSPPTPMRILAGQPPDRSGLPSSGWNAVRAWSPIVQALTEKTRELLKSQKRLPYATSSRIAVAIVLRAMTPQRFTYLAQTDGGKHFALRAPVTPLDRLRVSHEVVSMVIGEFLGLPMAAWRPLQVGHRAWIASREVLQGKPGSALGDVVKPGLYFGLELCTRPDERYLEYVPAALLSTSDVPRQLARSRPFDVWLGFPLHRPYVAHWNELTGDVRLKLSGSPGMILDRPGPEFAQVAQNNPYIFALPSNNSHSIVEDAFDSILAIPSDVLRALIKGVPSQWLSSRESREVLERLLLRREHMALERVGWRCSAQQVRPRLVAL